MRAAALLTMVLWLYGCGSLYPPGRPANAPTSAPVVAPAEGQTARALAVAQQMVGAPYRYGGNTPAGFDCSGLVQYSWGQAGREVPHSTEGLYSATRSIPAAQRAPGDLLFFRIDGKPAHVGIYLGNGRFVHAPSSGKQVEYASVNDAYWRQRLVKVGRF